ncbi:hypothetical protein H0H92_005709 [Tricholoma furcatifolium]|nr:hypothetical protein H0H92_005709 [Tricholoma furcatifolium]
MGQERNPFVFELCGRDIVKACSLLLRFERSKKCEEFEDSETEEMDKVVEAVRARIHSKLEASQLVNFSDADDDTLEALNLVPERLLRLIPGIRERVKESRLNGNNELWSSTHLHRQLHMLDRHVTYQINTATTRAWIEAFLFRASAMVPQDRRMVLDTQHVPPNTIGARGYTYYTVALANANDEGLACSSFFVTEAGEGALGKQIPQTVCQLYASAKQLRCRRRKTVRGALTNGRQWIFLILSLNDDRNGGGSWWQTYLQEYYPSTQHRDFDSRPVFDEPDIIAGILSHWVRCATVS